MNLVIFWLLGLLAIGVVTGILLKAFKVHTTRDSDTARGIIVWGCVIITLWVIYGGALVFSYININK
jgi:hypothetical protein